MFDSFKMHSAFPQSLDARDHVPPRNYNLDTYIFTESSISRILDDLCCDVSNCADIYERYFFSNIENTNRVYNAFRTEPVKYNRYKKAELEIANILKESGAVVVISEKQIVEQFSKLGIQCNYTGFDLWLKSNYPKHIRNSWEIYSLLTSQKNVAK